MIATLALITIIWTGPPPPECAPLGPVRAHTYIRRDANAAAAAVTKALMREAQRLGATAITPPDVRPWTYFPDSPHRLTVRASATAYRCDKESDR